MMFPSFLSHAGIAILVAAAASGPTHTWIADLKAKGSALAGQEVRIEGEVVDVRSTSPAARRGFYRLTDASDPAGVLVRSEEVPIDGGIFRLRAKVAEDQVVPGTLVLIELEREQTDARPLFPLILAVGSAVALALLAVMLRRAYAEERRYAVAPPLWLMPDSGPYGKALAMGGAVQPPLKYDPDLEETDRIQIDRLKRRKRGLLQATLGSLAVAGSSTAWVLTTTPAASQVPAFIFIDSSDPTLPLTSAAPTSADSSVLAGNAPAGGDTALGLTPAPRSDTARDRRSSTALALSPGTTRLPETRPRVADSVPVRGDTVRPDVTVTPPAPSPVPILPPPPLPPPPPPAVVTPVRDLEADRARAQTAVEEAAARLVGAINGKRSAEVALMLPEAMAGDLSRRERFLKLIRDFSPRASLGGVDPAAVSDDRGEGRIILAFAWRGDFGVDKKKTGRLQAVVRREGEAWRFEGARLLDAVP